MQVKYDSNNGSTIVGNIFPDMERVSFSKEFIRYHASVIFNVMEEMHRKETDKEFSVAEKYIVTKRSIEESAKQLQNMITDNPVSSSFIELLTKDLKKKEQIRLLKGAKLTIEQLSNLFYNAEEQGYSFSHFRFEGTPKNYSLEELPKFAYLNDDGSVEKIGGEKLTDGEVKAMIEQANVLIVRILEKDGHWHCFLQTFKGLKGKEAGKEGGRSHIHYISDKFCNLTFDDLKGMVKKGNYPSTPVHIPIVDK